MWDGQTDSCNHLFDEKMTYGFTTLATNFGPDTWQVKAIRTALFFIPKANPDNEIKYPQVRRWLLEIDHTGIPVREIALDDHGNPLFKAPDFRNHGFWTDSDKVFSREELSLTTKPEFEQLWEKTKTKESCGLDDHRR